MEDAPPVIGVKKKKGFFRRLLKWIFWLILSVIILVAIAAALVYRVPQKLGIFPTAADKVFTQTPDRRGADRLLAEAKAAGLNTTGMTLYVFPVGDGSESIALASLDVREGFSFNNTGGLDPISGVMTKLVGGPTARELGIKRVAVTYTDEKGRELATMTAPTASINAIASGQISRDAFLAATDGDINLPNVIDQQLDFFRNAQ